MASTKVLIGSAIRVARALYARRRVLPETDRERIAPPAEDEKEEAETDPEIEEEDVRRLREDLRRELERLAEAEIKASRIG